MFAYLLYLLEDSKRWSVYNNMTDKTITINKVLRHSMHDFLNNMHLIQLNIDMGKQEEAKSLIRSYAQKCSQFFDINNIGLFLTNEWLQTFPIGFNLITLEVETSLRDFKVTTEVDQEISEILEQFVQSIYPHLTGYQEQKLTVSISTEDSLRIQVEIIGEWSSYDWFSPSAELTSIEYKENEE